MATAEGFVLDPTGTPLDLNVLGGTFTLEQLVIPTPKKNAEWASGGDSDGARLVRDPKVANRECSAKVRIVAASRDAASMAIAQITAKLEEAEQQEDGLPILWTPTGATAGRTLYMLSGDVTDMPITVEDAWWSNAPLLGFNFTTKPFLYGSEIGNFLDDFSVDTITAGNWILPNGGSGLAVSGGLLVVTTTSNRGLLNQTAGQFYDSQVTAKFATGATVTTWALRVEAKADTPNSNYLYAGLSNASLSVGKTVGGAATTLATAAFAAVANTTYWLRCRVEGNLLTAEVWTSAPTVTGTPAATCSFTLTGGDIAQFGQGVSGYCGLRWSAAGDATGDFTVDSFTIEPNLYRSSQPNVSGMLANVPGDVPAEARVVLTDASNQARRFVEVGLEQRYFTPTTPSPLLIDSEDLVVTGFAGALATRTGGYRRSGATHDTVSATLLGQPIALCGTGVQPHVGTFRVKARIWATSTAEYWRLNWQEGDGPFRPNDWAVPIVAGDFSEIDLGLITVPLAKAGSQKWSGRIEAYTTTVGGEVGELDYLELIPAGEGYCKAEATYSYSPGAVTGHDEFTGTTAGNPLNARVAPAGGTWVTSGATTDFVFADVGSTEMVTRSTATDSGPRFAILGASTPTDVEVGLGIVAASYTTHVGVIARWTDASNYLRLDMEVDFGTGASVLAIIKRIAGVDTTIARVTITGPAMAAAIANASMRLLAFASGMVVGEVLDALGNVIVGPITCLDTSVATGGTLASGKSGFSEFTVGGSFARFYDNPYFAIPAAEPLVINAGRTIEFRSDDTYRQDSTGVYYGLQRPCRGSRIYVPPAGDKARTTRIMAKADRADLGVAADTPLGDILQMQVFVTPRYLAVPR